MMMERLSEDNVVAYDYESLKIRPPYIKSAFKLTGEFGLIEDQET